MSYFKKKDKYKKDYGMTVTVRQVKDKDGNITSDVNGAIRVLKKKLYKRYSLDEFSRDEASNHSWRWSSNWKRAF